MKFQNTYEIQQLVESYPVEIRLEERNSPHIQALVKGAVEEYRNYERLKQ